MIFIANIVVRQDEPLEKAIKRFKRQVDKEGIITEWKRRQYFEKPSAAKNRKRRSAERKRLKKLRKLQRRKMY